jgi:hypothetical protein
LACTDEPRVSIMADTMLRQDYVTPPKTIHLDHIAFFSSECLLVGSLGRSRDIGVGAAPPARVRMRLPYTPRRRAPVHFDDADLNELMTPSCGHTRLSPSCGVIADQHLAVPLRAHKSAAICIFTTLANTPFLPKWRFLRRCHTKG